MIRRAISKRFKFEYEYYNSDTSAKERMVHITILGDMPMQVHLWLDELDQKKLKEFLNEGDKE